MPEQTISPEDQMMQWITSKWISKPIYVVSELGIADLMHDGPKSVHLGIKVNYTCKINHFSLFWCLFF
jgi:hypothetical protein